jgi:hypothetical protein
VRLTNGFEGVVVYTRVQTPRFCGQASRAGTLLLSRTGVRGLRTSWLIVGIDGWFLEKSMATCMHVAAKDPAL